MQKLLLVLLSGVLLFIGAAHYYGTQSRRMETAYDSTIAPVASKYQVDPLLIRAVIWRESRFNSKAIGDAGERGLMQVMEIAASDWVVSEKVQGFQGPDLFIPSINLQAGTWYLARGLRRWKETDNPIVFALAEYNAGRGNVYRWIDPQNPQNSEAFLARIDYPGTKKYIEVILRRYELYKRRDSRPAWVSQVIEWLENLSRNMR